MNHRLKRTNKGRRQNIFQLKNGTLKPTYGTRKNDDKHEIIQRYALHKLQIPFNNSPIKNFLFDQRVADGTATSGLHNYAVTVGTWDCDRSDENEFAEMKLLKRGVPNRFGKEIMIVSEFKPAPECQYAIERFEASYGASVAVHYLIDEGENARKPEDTIRDFYKLAGRLSGGGTYPYSVVSILDYPTGRQPE